MQQRLALRRLSDLFRLVAVLTCATFCGALSIHNVKAKTHATTEKYMSTQSVGRRSLLLAPSLLWIGLQFPAKAVDENPNGDCVTECYYACETKTNKRLWPKSRDECRAKCPRKECLPPPPAKKREPPLVKASDIDGLYPRWQDTF